MIGMSEFFQDSCTCSGYSVSQLLQVFAPIETHIVTLESLSTFNTDVQSSRFTEVVVSVQGFPDCLFTTREAVVVCPLPDFFAEPFYLHDGFHSLYFQNPCEYRANTGPHFDADSNGENDSSRETGHQQGEPEDIAE